MTRHKVCQFIVSIEFVKNAMHISAIFVIILGVLVASCSGARILGFFGIPSISHQVVYRAVMLELANRGHNVTVITTDPINKSMDNYHEIDIHYSYDVLRRNVDAASDGAWLLRNVPEFFIYIFMKFMDTFCEMYLSDPKIAELIKNNEQFDLLIVEFGPMQCTYPFARQSNDIMIGMFSLGFGPHIHTYFGSTGSPAYIPQSVLSYGDHMTLYQRFRTIIYSSAMKLIVSSSIKNQQAIAEKYFGSNIPPLPELVKNVSLLIQNSHPTIGYPSPLTQMFVEIGGPPVHLHGYQPKPLPKDLQDFLDSAEDGVIYFSLGSNVKSSTMPESKRAIFLNAFRQIKQKVLWKWESDDLPGKPDNVKVHKWLPQTDVLAHPNIRAFITQGGLQSMGEATHFHIPLIVIPFLGDQELNARKLESVGVSISLNFETITEEEVLRAITDIIEDPKYKESMVKYAELTSDQPMSPMERGIWWIEYVLRHNGARHLRSAAVDMPWYQYFLVDVLAFLAAVLATVLYILHFTFSRLFRLLFRRIKIKAE